MKFNQYTIKNKVWLFPGFAAWHFVTIPKKLSADIKTLFGDRSKGWGSIPVTISLGSSQWKTSIFPDKKVGAYILPLKAEIRKKEGISVNDTITFEMEVMISATAHKE